MKTGSSVVRHKRINLGAIAANVGLCSLLGAVRKSSKAESGIAPSVLRLSAASFEPIVQRSIGTFAKLAFKAALATQPGKITCSRSGDDEPSCGDLAILDHFRAFEHEGALASAQLSAESLHADEARRFVVPENLQSSNR